MSFHLNKTHSLSKGDIEADNQVSSVVLMSKAKVSLAEWYSRQVCSGSSYQNLLIIHYELGGGGGVRRFSRFKGRIN